MRPTKHIMAVLRFHDDLRSTGGGLSAKGVGNEKILADGVDMQE